jgi:predicted CXXCH cytochrome family protein
VKNFLSIAAIVFILLTASNALAQAPNCEMCHPDLAQGKSVHAAVGMGCATCHSGVDATDIPHKFTSGNSKGLSAEAPDLCFMCHDKGKFSGKDVVHMPVAGGMCTGCHSPHSSGSEHLLLSDNVCTNCHGTEKFQKKVIHSPSQDGICSSCHEPHQSDKKKLLKTDSPELCYGCHRKEDFYGPTIHAPVGVGLCSVCHSPHSSDNRKLLLSNMPDLCFVCHDRSSFSLTSTHKPVKEGQCTECHRPHASQDEYLLSRKGNFLCRKCHAEVERGPHAITGFARVGHPLRGRRDPVRDGKTFGCLSCHLPHTSESQMLFRYKAETLYDLCGYCHQM